MRLELPDLLQGVRCLAQIVFAYVGLGSDDGGRHEILREFQRLQGAVARARRIGFQLVLGFCGKQDRLKAFGFMTFKDMGDLLLIEQADRIVPMTGAAAMFQRRLRCPWQVRRRLCCGFGILPGSFMRAEAVRFHIKTAQTKLPGLGIL